MTSDATLSKLLQNRLARLRSKGSFYAWMPVPEGYNSESFADLLLNEAHVAVAPGKGFGEQGDSYVRIGLLVEPERLIEAVERIGKLGVF